MNGTTTTTTTELSFSLIEGTSANIQAEVPKKVLCGIQTCQHVLAIEKDAYEMFSALAKKSGDLRRRAENLIPTITCPTGEMMGFLKAFETFTRLMTTISEEAEAVAITVQTEVSAPLSLSLKNLNDRKDEFLVRKASPHQQQQSLKSSLGNFPESPILASSPEDDKKRQKLHDRLLLANEEYQKAVESRDAIVGRFGTAITPTLLEKVEERIKRAGHLKRNAERELTDFDKGEELSGDGLSAVTLNAPYDVVPNGYGSVDGWELDRLKMLKGTFGALAKGMFSYHKRITTLVLQFGQDIDAFHPDLDKAMWLTEVLGRRTETGADLKEMKRSLDAQIVPLIRLGSLSDLTSLVDKPSDSDEVSQLRSALRTAQKRMNDSASEQRQVVEKCRDTEILLRVRVQDCQALQNENVQLKNKIRELSSYPVQSPTSFTLMPSPTNSPRPGELSDTATEVGGERKKKKKSKWGILGLGGGGTTKKEKVPPDKPPDSPPSSPRPGSPISGGERGGLQGEVQEPTIPTRLPQPTVGSLSLQSSQQLTPGTPRHSIHEETPRLGNQEVLTLEEPPSPRPPSEAQSQAPLVTELQVVTPALEFLPDLFKHLTAPVEQYSGATEAEYFIEIQRRYEEFLLAFRNFNLSFYVRHPSWQDSLYFRGIDVEEGFRFFPYKLPGGIAADVSREPYFMGLEWGAPQLDEFQWSCIAYETLLLVYLHLFNEWTAKKDVPLLKGDINTLKVEKAPERVNPPTQVQTTRRRSVASVPLTEMQPRPVVTEATPLDDAEIDAAIKEENLLTIKRIITLTRVKLGLAGSTNALIVQLTLPNSSEFDRMGQWCSIHPLDLRYRVVRLIDTWPLAGSIQENGQPLGADPNFRCWLMRQLHVLHTGLTYKLWRFLRFLPEKRAAFETLNGWGSRGPWHRDLEGLLRRFPKEVDQFFHGRLNTMLRLFEIGLQIISALATAAETMTWGVEMDLPESFTDVHRSSQGIHRLLQLMTCITTLDRLIRIRLSEDERGVTEGEYAQSTVLSPRLGPSPKPGLDDLDDSFDEDERREKSREYLRQGTAEFQALIDAPPSGQEVLSSSWTYELPLLQYVLSVLWKAVSDGTTSDALHFDGPSLACGLLIVSHTAQSGLDPSITEDETLMQTATLSIQTHALLLIAAIWQDTCSAVAVENFHSLDDELDAELDDSPRQRVGVSVGTIPTNALRTIHRLLDADEFCGWMCAAGPQQVENVQGDRLGTKSVQGSTATAGTGGTGDAQQLRRSQKMLYRRAERLVAACAPDPWETLVSCPRGPYRTVNTRKLGSTWMQNGELNDATDPDFFVLDVSQFRRRTFANDSSGSEDESVSRVHRRSFNAPPSPGYQKGASLVALRRQGVSTWVDQRSSSSSGSTQHPHAVELGGRHTKLQESSKKRKRLWARRKHRTEAPTAVTELSRLASQHQKGSARKLIRSSGSRVKPVPRRSRIFHGYQVLHKAGMQLTPSSYPELYLPFEEIREEPEGISLICPSRVELVMMEVLYARLISARFRTEVSNILCDYRYQLEPDALPIMIQIWDKTNQLTFINDSEPVQPVAPELTQFNINLPLPQLLSGPSPQFDLYRYFIYQTVISLANRLFTEARIAMSRDTATSIREYLNYPDDSVERRTALTECGEVVKLFGEALKSFINEIRGELEFYPKYWKDVLPSSQHALIVVYASRLALMNDLNVLLGSRYWPEEDLPPYGSMILEGIEAFECLAREVKIGTRLEISTEPDLLQNLTDCLTAALTKRFQAIEQTLQRCMQKETWEAAAGQPYSISIVDLFTFVHHLFHAIVDLHAPVNLMVPCFLQFLGRLSQNYSDFLLDDCNDERLLAASEACDFIFNHLHNPEARVEGVGEFVTLSGGTVRKKKARGAGGGMLKAMEKIAGGFGFKKKKKGVSSSKTTPDRISGSLASPHDEPQPSSDVNLRRLDSSAVPAGADQVGGGTDPTTTGGEGSEDSGHTDVSGRGRRFKKKKDKKKEKLPPKINIDLPENFYELQQRFGQQLALIHVQIKQGFKNTLLKPWLVRLHNLKFFCAQLPSLAQKFQELTTSMIKQRDPRYKQIIQSLEESEGRASKPRTEATEAEEFVGLYEDVALMDRLHGILEGAISSCQKAVWARAQRICRYISLRVIFYDFGEDFFEELYSPTFSRYTLENIIFAFKDTVERFITNAPEEFQGHLRAYMVEYIIKAWMLLVTELGYHGFVFGPEDMEVLDEDSEALKSYCIRQSVSPDIMLNEDTAQAVSVNMLNYVNDFFCSISSKPQVLAQLGGHYDPEKAKPQKEEGGAAPGGTDGLAFGATEVAPVPFENLFGLDDPEMGSPTGATPKKKKKKGWIKMLGL